MQRLWVTGYRSYELNVFGDKDPKITIIKYTLKNYFKGLLENDQLDWIITGANLGVEQWTAEVGLELGKKYPLRTSIMIPYEKFADRWNENNQTKFLILKERVDFFASTSNLPYQNPVQLRNYQNFMLQHTDRALMVYDTEHPGKPKYDYNLIQKYQKAEEYPLDLIDFYDLQDAAEEYQEAHQRNYFSE
ncbi:DUF1273 domain-containing protein [Lactobacillus helveticus]|uniref:DUF1273 domain-containing protein n=1 Tax=Lactobacillus helveticus TaxID=1587 RepID=UPI001C64511C|nr:DUF1273 domain-containing protein [Lactobacillus helveticus]MBW8009140.1 DUF1273 domain-containing protein [Lactobacillus helveticus]MBW8019181.1 DUF1273 domain-containing protein [Lactobacillus helveticus]MBW8043828.1 DUF1273 domain-containing protein [Lactobacillus helveticus]MBW8052387.1 DUF1273 domain-containing protein [Lactobacillus helveticus]